MRRGHYTCETRGVATHDVRAGGDGGEDPYGVQWRLGVVGTGGGGGKRPASAAAAAAAALGGDDKRAPAQGPTRPWYRHDDSFVSRVPAAEVFGPKAQSSCYMLCYQLVE
jgi:hypothetical protein